MAASDTLTAANALITAHGLSGNYAVPRVQPYRAPVERRAAIVSARVRARNLAAMDARVEAWRDFASGMPAAEARRYLDAKANSLNATLYLLGPSATEGLRGITAFDVSGARDRLMAAVPRPLALTGGEGA